MKHRSREHALIRCRRAMANHHREPKHRSSAGSPPPFPDTRYSLPTLLGEVKRDRSSAAFAMEKLDQPAINELFERRRSRRAAKIRKQ